MEKTFPLSLRIEKDIYIKIKEEAKTQGRTIAKQINCCLRKQIENDKETKEILCYLQQQINDIKNRPR